MEEKNKILEISEIKNLVSIKIDRLMDTPDLDDPGLIIVFYDDGKKTLVVSELDKEYLYLFNTIRRVYNEEKNKRRIIIDELSKNFIEANEPNIELATLKKSIGNQGVSKKISYKSKTIEMYYNILKYLLENIFTYFNRKIEIKELKGMSKHFKFVYKEEELRKNLPFTFQEKENTLKFIFPGIFENGEELYIDIKYNEKILIDIYDKNKKIHFNYECVTTPEYGKIISTLYINGILNSKVIDNLETINLNNILEYKPQGITYLLPWKDKRGVNYTKTKGELLTELIEYIDYLENLQKDHIMIRKKIIQKVTKQGFGRNMLEGFYKIKGDLTLKTDDEIIITNYYKVDNYIIKETEHLGTNLSRGIYKSALEGKVFYKILLQKENDLEEYINDIPESTKGYELINENELKLLLRRREN